MRSVSASLLFAIVGSLVGCKQDGGAAPGSGAPATSSASQAASVALSAAPPSSAAPSSSAAAITCTDSDPLLWKPWSAPGDRCVFRVREDHAPPLAPVRWEPCPEHYVVSHGCRRLVRAPGDFLSLSATSGRLPGKGRDRGFVFSFERECKSEVYVTVADADGKVLSAIRRSADDKCKLSVSDVSEDHWVGTLFFDDAKLANDETGIPPSVGVIGAPLGGPPHVLDELPHLYGQLDLRASRSGWVRRNDPTHLVAGKDVHEEGRTVGGLAVPVGDAMLWAHGSELVLMPAKAEPTVLTTFSKGAIVGLESDGHDVVLMLETTTTAGSATTYERRLVVAPFATDPAAFAARELGPIAHEDEIQVVGCGRVLVANRNEMRLVGLADGAVTRLPGAVCEGSSAKACWVGGMALTCEELVAGVDRTLDANVIRVELASLGSASAPGPSAPAAIPSAIPSASARVP